MFGFGKSKQQSPNYTYKSLPKDHIRVLELDPGRSGDGLRGRLVAQPFGIAQASSTQNSTFSLGNLLPILQRKYSSESKWEDEVEPTTDYEDSSEEESSDDESGDDDDTKKDTNNDATASDHSESFFPSYNAVSYSWGQPPVFDTTIELESGVLQISNSAAGALNRFRRRKAMIPLWVDGICINQQDNDEKDAQVSIMGAIYREAQRVLVWLGEAVPTDCYAFYTITATQAQKQAAAESKWFVSDDALMESFVDPLEDKPYAIVTPKKCPFCSAKIRVKTGGPLPVEEKLLSDEPFRTKRRSGFLGYGASGTDDYTVWESIQLVLKRPYFRRLWPLQEVLIPGEKRTWYFAGAHYANAASFHYYALASIKLFGSIDGSHDSLTRRFMQLSLREKNSSFKGPLASIIGKQKQDPSTELLDLILDSSSMDSTLPHDRVYALRAMMKAGDAEALTPKYSTPIDSLWQQVVNLHIQSESPDSVIIALAGRQKCEGKVELETSWLPDFHHLTSGPSLAKLTMHKKAESSFKLNITDRNTVSTHAMQIGKVGRLFERTEYPNDLRRIKAWAQSQPQFARTFKYLDLDIGFRATVFIKWILYPYYYGLWCKLSEVAHDHSKDIIVDNFNEFILQGIPGIAKSSALREDEDADEADQRSADVAIQEVMGNIQSHVAKFVFSFRGQRPKAPMRSIQHDPMKSLPFPWESKASWVDHHRGLCALEDGRVGWVPDVARIGDTLWLLEGCPIPFLLRERDDGTYENFGDTYIAGIGGAKPLWKEDSILSGLPTREECVPVEIR